MALPAIRNPYIEKWGDSTTGESKEWDAWPACQWEEWNAFPACQWKKWDAFPARQWEKWDASLPACQQDEWYPLPACQWEKWDAGPVWEVCKACIYDTSAGMVYCPSCKLSSQIYIDQLEDFHRSIEQQDVLFDPSGHKDQLEGVHLRTFGGGFIRARRLIQRAVGWWQRF